MEYSPIIISMKTACLSIVITFFLGVIFAKMIFALKNKKVKMIFDSFFTLPLVFPPTIVGFFLLFIFGVRRPVGMMFLNVFGIKIAFSWGATVIAAVIMSFPLMYRSARAAFEQVDKNIIYASRTLGLSENKIFWKIIMPLSKEGLISGAVLAFARGFGEFGATAMIAGNIKDKTRTLPLAVYSAVAAGDMDGAYDYVLIILIISFTLIFLINYFTSNSYNRGM